MIRFKKYFECEDDEKILTLLKYEVFNIYFTTFYSYSSPELIINNSIFYYSKNADDKLNSQFGIQFNERLYKILNNDPQFLQLRDANPNHPAFEFINLVRVKRIIIENSRRYYSAGKFKDLKKVNFYNESDNIIGSIIMDDMPKVISFLNELEKLNFINPAIILEAIITANS